MPRKYARGKRYLAAIKTARKQSGRIPSQQRERSEISLPTFAKDDPGGKIAERIGRQHRIDKKVIREHGQFATAVDYIARNCGKRARDLILSGNSRLAEKEVMTISRMAPERQRYELTQ